MSKVKNDFFSYKRKDSPVKEKKNEENEEYINETKEYMLSQVKMLNETLDTNLDEEKRDLHLVWKQVGLNRFNIAARIYLDKITENLEAGKLIGTNAALNQAKKDLKNKPFSQGKADELFDAIKKYVLSGKHALIKKNAKGVKSISAAAAKAAEVRKDLKEGILNRSLF